MQRIDNGATLCMALVECHSESTTSSTHLNPTEAAERHTSYIKHQLVVTGGLLLVHLGWCSVFPLVDCFATVSIELDG